MYTPADLFQRLEFMGITPITNEEAILLEQRLQPLAPHARVLEEANTDHASTAQLVIDPDAPIFALVLTDPTRLLALIGNSPQAEQDALLLAALWNYGPRLLQTMLAQRQLLIDEESV